MKYKLKKAYPGSPPAGSTIDGKLIKSDITINVTNHPEYWEEVRVSMQTTVDGVPLYEGDLFTYMDSEGFINKQQNKMIAPLIVGKAFSTYEAAQKWKIVNMITLAIKDVVDVFPFADVNLLIEKVKEKANGKA